MPAKVKRPYTPESPNGLASGLREDVVNAPNEAWNYYRMSGLRVDARFIIDERKCAIARIYRNLVTNRY